jgi:hypothetical protein
MVMERLFHGNSHGLAAEIEKAAHAKSRKKAKTEEGDGDAQQSLRSLRLSFVLSRETLLPRGSSPNARLDGFELMRVPDGPAMFSARTSSSSGGTQ